MRLTPHGSLPLPLTRARGKKRGSSDLIAAREPRVPTPIFRAQPCPSPASAGEGGTRVAQRRGRVRVAVRRRDGHESWIASRIMVATPSVMGDIAALT